MIGAICAAIGGAVLNNVPALLRANSTRPRTLAPALRPEIAPTQFVQLPPSNNIVSPHDGMHSPNREAVIVLAGQAYAASGHPFWARKRMQESDEVTRHDLAV